MLLRSRAVLAICISKMRLHSRNGVINAFVHGCLHLLPQLTRIYLFSRRDSHRGVAACCFSLVGPLARSLAAHSRNAVANSGAGAGISNEHYKLIKRIR